MPDKLTIGPWKLALIRMLQPNSDLTAEICEWIIALGAGLVLFVTGFILGRFTK